MNARSAPERIGSGDARHPDLRRGEVRFAEMPAEVCAATNSYLLEALGAGEIDEAGGRAPQGPRASGRGA